MRAAQKLDWSKMDWGWIDNRLLEEARQTVAQNGGAYDLISNKMKEINACRTLEGAARWDAVTNRTSEMRALIAAVFEYSFPELEKTKPASLLFDVVMKVEELRETSSVTDRYGHQLKLEAACDSIAMAVTYLLALQIKQDLAIASDASDPPPAEDL